VVEVLSFIVAVLQATSRIGQPNEAHPARWRTVLYRVKEYLGVDKVGNYRNARDATRNKGRVADDS
jgi:hypothetical protein